MIEPGRHGVNQVKVSEGKVGCIVLIHFGDDLFCPVIIPVLRAVQKDPGEFQHIAIEQKIGGELPEKIVVRKFRGKTVGALTLQQVLLIHAGTGDHESPEQELLAFSPGQRHREHPEHEESIVPDMFMDGEFFGEIGGMETDIAFGEEVGDVLEGAPR